MIEIENLTKTFGTQTVISDVSGIFYTGKINGFVGRNGSGKTVLMKMILGFIKPTSGTIKVNGKQDYNHFLSYAFQKMSVCCIVNSSSV